MQRGDQVTESAQFDPPTASTGTRSEAEQETVLRWDEEDKELRAWTTCRSVGRAWFNAGWPVTVDGTIRGRACSWKSQVPAKAITFRNLASLGGPTQTPEAREASRQRLKAYHEEKRRKQDGS